MEYVVAALILLGGIYLLRRRNRGMDSDTVASAVIFDPPASGKSVEVVGENSYQGSIEIIAGGRNIDGANVRDHKALLVPEPTNPYDKNAIAVRILGRQVGYLNRKDAVAYAPVIARIMATGNHVGCLASIRGGWDRGDGEPGSFGVRLALGTPTELDAEFDEWTARQVTPSA